VFTRRGVFFIERSIKIGFSRKRARDRLKFRDIRNLCERHAPVHRKYKIPDKNINNDNGVENEFTRNLNIG